MRIRETADALSTDRREKHGNVQRLFAESVNVTIV